MRFYRTAAAFALILPLAGCFDAEVTADLTDVSAVRLDGVMTMSAEIYQMAASMGEDPCEDGIGEEQSDGSFTCTMSEVRSLDELIELQSDPNNDLGIGDGIAITRVGDDTVSLAFDLSEMTRDLPSAEERAQMSAMFGDAFVGHAITMSVVGEEIIETNGVISDDGTTATFAIPLEVMFAPGEPDLPESFDVMVRTGG